MDNNLKILSQVAAAVKEFNLVDVAPKIISDNANLIIHLDPYPIVARVAKYYSKEFPDKTYDILNKELEVGQYLQSKDIPIVLPYNLTGDKPYNVNGLWMTFWEYISPRKTHPISPAESMQMINDISKVMIDYPEVLPKLGVWDRVTMSAKRLKNNTDVRIQSLLNRFEQLDSQIRSIAPEHLIPCHGDAHAGNIISSSKGWLWLDFEDASLMPRYWDEASYVGNNVLFGGFNKPIFQLMIKDASIASNYMAFKLALTARTLMSVIGNYDLAIEGYGDLKFAKSQLIIVGEFLLLLDLYPLFS